MSKLIKSIKNKTSITEQNLTNTHNNCIKSSDGKCIHTIIHKVPMKGRNVNGNRPIKEKGTLVIKLDNKFKRDMSVLIKHLGIKSPTDICRQLVSDMAEQYRGLKKSKNKLTD